MPQALVVRGLSKRYGAVQALRGVDLEVGEGELFGFLGPNGAGKTTAMRMLLGLLRPDQGGRCACLGVTPNTNCPMRLTVSRVSSKRRTSIRNSQRPHEPRAVRGLRRWRGYLGGLVKCSRPSVWRDEPVTRWVGTRRGCGNGSGSPCRYCANPKLLILDEPTNGLDPGGILDMRGLIKDLAERGHDDLPLEPPTGRGGGVRAPGSR